MSKLLALLVLLALPGCIGVGHRKEICFYGIQAPFVAVGVDGAPFGGCR